MDDFGIQYFNKDDADHLINALQSKYIITIATKGKKICGLNIDWNYTNGWVDISMKGYVKNVLDKLGHTKTRIEHAPHEWNVPIYGKNRQFAT